MVKNSVTTLEFRTGLLDHFIFVYRLAPVEEFAAILQKLEFNFTTCEGEPVDAVPLNHRRVNVRGTVFTVAI